MAPQSRLVHVVAGVIEHQGRYLLALRAAGRSLAGYWEFPGGKVEAGEDPRVALARELEEELAATDVRVGAALGERPHEYGNLTVLIDAYQVACHIGSLRPLEHERIEWFSLQQMRGIQLAPADEFLVPLLAARSDV